MLQVFHKQLPFGERVLIKYQEKLFGKALGALEVSVDNGE